MLKFLKAGAIVFAALLSIYGCKEEVALEKFVEKDNPEAALYYDNNVALIMNNQCNSCHNYHNTLDTEYRSYGKVVENLDNIIDRINTSERANIMPPMDVAVLSNEQKDALNEFFAIVNGDQSEELEIKIGFTAFKFPTFDERAGVSGTFDSYSYLLKNNEEDIFDRLKNAELSINTSSVNIGGSAEKSSNVGDHFFSYLVPVIHCKVNDLDADSLYMTMNLNGLSQNVVLETTQDQNTLVFSGSIKDMRKFDTEYALKQFDKICGEYHEGFVWPDLDISIEIKNYDNLR